MHRHSRHARGFHLNATRIQTRTEKLIKNTSENWGVNTEEANVSCFYGVTAKWPMIKQHDVIVENEKVNLTPPSSSEAEVSRPAERIHPLIEIEEEEQWRSG